MDASAAVILVNGLPGAGKSTLARALARHLRLPLISKDVIKETHADILGAEAPDGRPQRVWNNALGAAASETMWALLADAQGGAVLESTWLANVRPLVAAGLARAGVGRPLEIWCDVPLDTARARDTRRRPNRHRIHGAPMTDDEWEVRRERTEPLGLGPLLRVNTTQPVDLEGIAAWIARN